MVSPACTPVTCLLVPFLSCEHALCVLHCSAWSSVQRGGHSSLPCQTCLPLPYETDDTLFFDQRPKRFDGPISCQVTSASAEKQRQNGMLSL